MSVDYQNSILWRGEDPTKRKFKPTHDASSKQTRYFPGKVPAWAKKGEEEEKEEAKKDKDNIEPRSKRRRDRTAAAIIPEDHAGASV